MNIRQLLLIVVGVLIGTSGALADDLTPEAAKQKAATFLLQKKSASGRRNAKAATAADLQMKQVAVDAKNLYVFNVGNTDGFVIMANDDNYDRVLGYSDNGHLDPNDMPEALQEMLQAYNKSVGVAKAARRKAPTTGSEMAPVKPMLKTYYNQSGVYNMYLPIVKQPDEEGNSRRMAPTGCVSAAMAQIMAYWQWPSRVEAIPGYVMDKTGSDEDITIYDKNPNCVNGGWMDIFTPGSGEVKPLPAYNVNWDNIYQGSYDDDYFKGKWSSASSYNKVFANYWSGTTLTKMQEIGRLFLYACSSLQMYYTYTGSGAKSADMITLLPKYFGYKNQIKKNERRNFTQEAWEQLLYNEISNGRPVIYAGKAQKATGGTGAHAYILDGYDGAGLWHVNWGWNGSCDGYYDFENLSPYGLPDDTDGYTVSETGYVINQICLTGIEPNTRDGKLTVVDSEMKDNENGEPSVYVYVDNMSNEQVSRAFSWAILNDDGTLENKSYGSKRTLTMPPSSTLSYDSKDQWYDDDHIDAHRRYYNATIADLQEKLGLKSGSSYKIVAVARDAASESLSDYVIADGAENHVFNINIESTYDNSAEAAVDESTAGKYTVAAIEVKNNAIYAYYDNENEGDPLSLKATWAWLKDDGTFYDKEHYYSGVRTLNLPYHYAEGVDYNLKDEEFSYNGVDNQKRFFSATFAQLKDRFDFEEGTYKVVPALRPLDGSSSKDNILPIGAEEHYFTITVDAEKNVTSATVSTNGLFTVAATEVKEKDGVPTLFAYYDNENIDEISSTVTWARLKSDGKLSGGYQNYKTLTLPTLSSCTYGKTDESFMVGETERSRHYYASVERIQKELKLTESGTYTVVPVMSNQLQSLKLAIGSVKHAFTITVDEHQNVTATTTTVDVPNASNRLTVSYVEYKDGNLRAYFDNPNADVTTNSINIRRLKEDGSYQSFSSTAKDLTLPTSSTANTATTTEQVILNGRRVDRYYEIGAEEILKKCGLIKTADGVTTYTAGTYTFHMCCKPADGSAYQPCEGTDKYYFTVELAEDGTISVVAHPEKLVALKSCEVIGDFLTGTVHELKATFQNTSADELAGQVLFQIIPVTYDADNNPVDGTSIDDFKTTYVLHGNSTESFKMAYTFNEAGNYKVRARLELGGSVVTKYKPSSYFEIKQKTTERPNSQLTLNFAGIEGVHQVGNRFYLTGDKLEGNAVVTNTGDASTTSEMNTIIQLWSVKDPAKENLIDQIRIKGIVAPGQTIELPFHFRNLDLTPGKTYYFRTYHGTASLTAEGYNGWGTYNDKWYEVMGTPSVKTWAADGEEATEWVVPTYESNKYTYALNAQDKAAIDITNFEAVMTNTSTDQYSFAASSNPNALYFMSAEAKNKLATQLNGKNVIVDGTAETLTLTDGYPFFTPETFKATSASYSRTFTIGNKKRVGGGWQSVVLPFTVNTVKNGENAIKWFKSSNDDASFWVYQLDGEKSGDYDTYDLNFTYNSTESMDANRPYIMAVPDESWAGAEFSLVGKTLVFGGENVTVNKVVPTVVETDHFKFVGTYVGATGLENAYVLNEAGESFVSGITEVQPFNAYIQKKDGTSAGARINISFGDDFVTAIKGVRTDSSEVFDNSIYDIQGRKMETLSKGIYIKNGRKFVVK